MEIAPLMLLIVPGTEGKLKVTQLSPRGGNCFRKLHENLFEVLLWFISLSILYGAVGKKKKKKLDHIYCYCLIGYAIKHACKLMSACMYVRT